MPRYLPEKNAYHFWIFLNTKYSFFPTIQMGVGTLCDIELTSSNILCGFMKKRWTEIAYKLNQTHLICVFLTERFRWKFSTINFKWNKHLKDFIFYFLSQFTTLRHSSQLFCSERSILWFNRSVYFGVDWRDQFRMERQRFQQKRI